MWRSFDATLVQIIRWLRPGAVIAIAKLGPPIGQACDGVFGVLRREFTFGVASLAAAHLMLS